MKRLSLAIVFVCCTLAVAAQGDGFRVNYQGAKPTIKDFALAYIASTNIAKRTTQTAKRSNLIFFSAQGDSHYSYTNLSAPDLLAQRCQVGILLCMTDKCDGLLPVQTATNAYCQILQFSF